MKAQPEDTAPNRGAATIRRIHRRRIMIRNEQVLRNLREGRTDQRLGEVPIEVDLDSCKDLPEVHPSSADKLNPECNLADFTTIKSEAP